MAIDVTDSTFQTEVMDRSNTNPVVVDLWAPWCGPCKTLGPVLEQVTDETKGEVVLAKVNVDENPQVSAAFRVQSIPAVYAVRDGQVVDGFVGAYPEHVVRQFVESLKPTEGERTVSRLLEVGDEASLREALELEPGSEDVVVALAERLVDDERPEEALALLARIPASDRTRLVAAKARIGEAPTDDFDEKLAALLDKVKDDEDARREYLDILELMGPTDPRTTDYRRQLTSRLF